MSTAWIPRGPGLRRMLDGGSRAGITVFPNFRKVSQAKPSQAKPSQAKPSQAKAGEGEGEFDFGTVLASGQTLEHRFRITNPGSRPVRLLKAEAQTPCCSSIGPLPESIPAGGSAEFPVQLKAGFLTGLQRVNFFVLTDSEARPIIPLVLSATLHSAIEVEFSDGTATSLPAGRPGILKLTVTCRRKGKEGYGTPSKISTTSPAKGQFVGDPIAKQLVDGINQVERQVEIDLPGSSEPGVKTVGLFLAWADQDRTDKRTFTWSVTPALRVTPPAFVLKATADKPVREAIVRSTGTPFRILRVEGRAIGPGLVVPTTSATEHVLSLPLDPSVVGVSDVRIHTDHPGQPTVKMSVLIEDGSSGMKLGRMAR